MRTRCARASLFLLALVIVGCSRSRPAGPIATAPATAPAAVLLIPTAVVPQAPQQIHFEGIGQEGIFDAALDEDGSGRIWMSYSAVEAPPEGAQIHRINTRVGYSDDGGANWQDAGIVVNQSEAQALPDTAAVQEAVWFNEVSDLVYDPFAEPEARWQLVWHEYLRVLPADGTHSAPAFEHGWIAFRTAPSPEGPWSPMRKLFVGTLYDTSDNAIPPGAPEFKLNVMFPGSEAMGGCAAFTEPSLLAREEGLYLAMKCSQGNQQGKVVLLLCNHAMTSCDYLGDFIQDNQASAFDAGYNGFSAPELVDVDGESYLFLTPTEDDARLYSGCLAFPVADLAAASLESAPLMSLQGAAGSFSGACSYAAGATASGIIYNQANLQGAPDYSLFSSGHNLP